MPSTSKETQTLQLVPVSPDDLTLTKAEKEWFTKEQLDAYQDMVKNYGILDEPKRFSSRGLLMLRANTDSWKTSEFVKFLHGKLTISTAEEERQNPRWFNPNHHRANSSASAASESNTTQSKTPKEETTMADITMTELQASMNKLQATIEKCDVNKLAKLDVDAINKYVANAKVSKEAPVVDRPLLRKITKIGMYTLAAGAIAGVGYAGYRYWQQRNGDAQTTEA